MAPRASRSTRSFNRCPECPFTQCHSISWARAKRCSSSHRSRFFTELPWDLRQPVLTHMGNNSVMPRRKYSESVCNCTRCGTSSDCRASMAARSSMRLLVVRGTAPVSSLVPPSNARIAAQPPDPGLPAQAPSVCTRTPGSFDDPMFTSQTPHGYGLE